MTEIERKALALVNEVSIREWTAFTHADPWTLGQALCRAIEQHEAFRQQVSDVVEAEIKNYEGLSFPRLSRFILPKPDPLVEAWNDMLRDSKPGEDRLEVFRNALAARGGKIVWEGE